MMSSSDALKALRRRKRSAATNLPATQPPTLDDYLALWGPTAQSLTEAVCVVDRSGRIRLSNMGFQLLLGYSADALLNKDVLDFVECNKGALGAPFDEAFYQRGSLDFGACDWRRADGGVLSAPCSVRAIVHGGSALGATIIAREVGGIFPQEDTRHADMRLRMVQAVGDIALAQLPLDNLLKALVDSLLREMELENVAILLVGDDGATATIRVASGAGASLSEQVRMPIDEGTLGHVIRERRSRSVANMNNLEVRSPYLSAELRASMKVESMVMTPLIVEDRVIGALYVGASELNHFTPDDVRMVEMVAQRVALAIERARASDAAARAHERLRFLNDASGALNATLDYHDTTRRLAHIISPALADACAIYLLEDDGLLRKVEMWSPSADNRNADTCDTALRQLIERLDDAIEVKSDDDGGAIACSVLSLEPTFERQPLPTASEHAVGGATATCVCAPLVVRKHALGAIYLARRPGNDFSEGDMALVLGLAERAAIAIDNSRLYKETQEALASGSATATQLDTIINATNVGIFVLDASGWFRVNPYGAELLGLEEAVTARRADAPDLPFEVRTLEGDPIPQEAEPIYLARTEGRSIEQRLVIHRKDTGKDIQVLTRSTPWRDANGQIAGAVAVVTDITAIHELERQKDEFLAIASHELKTPLTTLKILAQVLKRRLDKDVEPLTPEHVTRMETSILRMERLIADLLHVSLIQEGKLPLNPAVIDLREVCEEVISEQRLLTQRSITFSAPKDADLTVYADKERINQALTNLLSNALKYSPEPEHTAVRARVTPTECIITVHDHGPGLPREAIDSIFDRFFRVPGMQVQSGSGFGLGLGLHISKDIILRHGGRIWVESELGHGSDFSFALPRWPPHDQ
jgi:PAS domain S-box-containing protein